MSGYRKFNPNRFTPDPKPAVTFKEPKPLKKKHKPTGELDLFRMIWNEREHFCINCECVIREHRDKENNVIINPINFHHLKPKSRYPELRLNKKNIVIWCFDCHFAYHNLSSDKFIARQKKNKYLGKL